jgi:site-specific DNA recombinase
MGSQTAVIYCRVSDPSNQDTARELEQQEQACRAYAAEHGISVLRAVRDSYTGTELVARMKLWEAIDDIKHGRADTILVYAYDRISRGGIADTSAIRFEVERKYRGQLLSATEPVPDGPMGELVQSIYASMAANDRINIVRKFARGKRYRAAQGHLSAAPHPMYGYRWADDEPGKRTRYVVDEDSAAVVRRIFAWAAEGQPLRWIARQLNTDHVLTPSAYAARGGHGGRRTVGEYWQPETVRRMLRDKAYTGQAVAYRWVRTAEYVKDKHTGIMGKVRTLAQRAEDDTERIALPETTWPALVDMATYNAVQERMGKDGANTREGRRNLKNTEAYLLRGGHVYCGVCGAKMEGAKRTDGAYIYRCPRRPVNAAAPEVACAGKGQTIRVHLLDAAAWDDAKYALEHTENLRTALHARLEGGAQEDQTARHLSNVEGVLNEKREQRDRLAKRVALTQDEDTASVLMRDVDSLSAEMRDLEKERAEARATLGQREDARARAERIMARIVELTRTAQKDWNATDEHKLQALAGKVVERVVNPLPPALDALSYEERRQALYLLGLRVRVYPTDHEYTRAHGKRWEIVMDLAGADEGSVKKQTN